ncbi:hypothetical protein SUGI_0197530 [Cryptomeria japonica]|nr:hypothetical protein SUGI_0197530 [Cryptomeria japonica]
MTVNQAVLVPGCIESEAAIRVLDCGLHFLSKMIRNGQVWLLQSLIVENENHGRNMQLCICRHCDCYSHGLQYHILYAKIFKVRLLS